jgi:hypothetical protein
MLGLRVLFADFLFGSSQVFELSPVMPDQNSKPQDAVHVIIYS